jgi:hypothetical protein
MICELPQLCASGATVIWTHGRRPKRSPIRRWGWAIKHRRLPRPRPEKPIREWFAQAHFEEFAYDEIPRGSGRRTEMIGVHRFRGTPRPIQPGTRLFRFGSPGDRRD